MHVCMWPFCTIFYNNRPNDSNNVKWCNHQAKSTFLVPWTLTSTNRRQFWHCLSKIMRQKDIYITKLKQFLIIKAFCILFLYILFDPDKKKNERRHVQINNIALLNSPFLSLNPYIKVWLYSKIALVSLRIMNKVTARQDISGKAAFHKQMFRTSSRVRVIAVMSARAPAAMSFSHI